VIAQNQDKVVKNLQEGLGGIRDVLLDNSQDYFTQDFRTHDKVKIGELNKELKKYKGKEKFSFWNES